jgi:fibronectin-binding autotransporter adhesin
MNRGELRNLWTNVNRNSSIRKHNHRGAIRSRAELIFASALVVAAGSHLASGSTASWIGTDSANFSDTANWSLAGGISGVTAANLQFGATGNTSPVNDLTSQTWSSLNFLSGAQAFDLTGNGFTLDASSVSSIINSSTSLQTIGVPVTLSGSRGVDAAAGPIAFTDGLAGTSGVEFGFASTGDGDPSGEYNTVIMDSTATYSGTTSVYSGTLQVGSAGNLPTGPIVLGNATNSTLGYLVLGDSGGPVTQSFTSITTTTNTVTYGSSIIGGNTLNATASIINPIIASGTGVTYEGIIGVSGGTASQNNVELEVGNLGTGGGTFTLHNSDYYTGGTVIANGTLVLDAGGAYPASTPLTMGDSNNDSATLNLYNSIAEVSDLTIVGSGTMTIGTGYTGTSAKATLEYNGGTNTSTFAGQIVNRLPGATATVTVGTFVEMASGTLILTNSSNSYALGTQLNGTGTLIFSPGSIGTGSVVLDGGTLQYSLSNTTDITSTQTGGLVMANSGGTINTNGNNVNFAHAITPDATGTGGFTKAGLGTMTFSADNLFAQKTTVSGGTLLIASTGGIDSSTVGISSGATLTVSGSISTSTAMGDNGTLISNIPTMEVGTLNGTGTVTLNGSTLQVDSGGTFSGVIGQSGTGGSVVVTGGTLALSGINTYSGGTTISGGTLQTGSTNALGTGPVAVASPGILDLDGNSPTIGNLSGSGTVDNVTVADSATLVITTSTSSNFSGVIQNTMGSVALSVNGTGAQILSGANTYQGTTTVNGGTLLAGAANSLSPNSSITVAGGTLDVSGSPQTIPSLTVNSGGTLNLGIGNVLTDTGTASFGGTLNIGGSPSGPSVELMSYTSDSGTFATIPTFAGYNLVYGGTELELVAIAGAANLTWNNNSGNFLWDTAASSNWNNGSSNTVFHAQDNVTFNDNNPSNTAANYAVTLDTLVSPGSVTVNNSNGNYTISGTGTIGGTGSLTKSGTGTLTLSTPNTYSGGSTVTAGKLLIAQAGTNATFSGSALVTANTLTALPTGTLSISGSGIVQLADGVTNQTFVTPNAHSSVDTSNINLTSLSITGSGTLDIGNNRIIVDYTSGNDPIASIAAWIKAGFNDGETPGAGPSIISSDIATDDTASGYSYGIGYADGADNLVAGLPSGEIEIMYTLLGDANLDGTVNGEDFSQFSSNLGASPRVWDQGDFNYDGTVNGEDFASFSHNLGQTDSLAASETGTVTGPLELSNGISLANVPEPASLGLLTLGVVGVLARRRRL